jgi:antitoxin component of MazEF toxin-antitoxin module
MSISGICSERILRGHQFNKVINMKELYSILWKIGSSVVITVPASIVKTLDVGINGGMLSVSMKVGRDSIKFVAKPWKCGGSHVVTVPSTYVELYGLRVFVKDKTKVVSSIRRAQVNNGKP